jgi:hypothetical protein
MPGPDLDAFVAALLERHVAPMRRAEFLKALRALSARYVERRASLPDRSPLDTPGKRAAFAAYYAPLHYLTVTGILRGLGSAPRAARPAITRILDLGCGTGVAGAAWASALGRRPDVHGVDRSGWALGEAAWTYRALGLTGRASRADLVATAPRLAARAERETAADAGVVLAWSANELTDAARQVLLPRLLDLARRGAAVLVVEPISHRAVPWFETWTASFVEACGRVDEWRLDEPRPPALSALARDAGLSADALLARSLAINLP